MAGTILGAGNTTARVRLRFGKVKRSKRLAIKATHTLQGTDPDRSPAVDQDAPDIMIHQAVLLGEIRELGSVVSGNTAFRREPEIAIFVLDDPADSDTPKPFPERKIVQRETA